MVKKLNNFYKKSGKTKRFRMLWETLGDANSFYRAVCESLISRDAKFPVERLADRNVLKHFNLRQQAVAVAEEEFNKNPQSEKMQEFVAAFKPDENARTFSEAIEKQKMDATCATFEFVYYTAVSHGIDILVLDIEDDGSVRERLAAANPSDPVAEDRRVILAHEVKMGIFDSSFFKIQKWFRLRFMI
jgi:hypothetical protein